MNVLTLRDRANAAAQDAFRRLLAHRIETGVWDRKLSEEYHVLDELAYFAEERVREQADPEESYDGTPDIPLAAPRLVDLGDHFRWPEVTG